MTDRWLTVLAWAVARVIAVHRRLARRRWMRTHGAALVAWYEGEMRGVRPGVAATHGGVYVDTFVALQQALHAQMTAEAAWAGARLLADPCAVCGGAVERGALWAGPPWRALCARCRVDNLGGITAPVGAKDVWL